MSSARNNNENDNALTVNDVSLKLFKRQGFLGRKTAYHWALKNISFSVKRGQVLGVIGRNGAGKSSLLRLLSTIIEPDEGRIKSHGLSCCMLTLQSGLFPDLSGQENAVISGMLLGNSYKRMTSLLPKIKDFSELGGWFSQPVSTYSSGMKTRLGFSVAMNAEADIILIDEVLGVGDAVFVEKSRQAIKDLLKSNKTVVLISHALNTILDSADKVIWIEKGRLLYEGSPKEAINAYTLFTTKVAELCAHGVDANEASDKAALLALKPLH